MRYFSEQDRARYGETLVFLRDVVTRFLAPQSPGYQDLMGNIERLRRRLDDPSLYLAVVGAFSTGKTTLINALIKDDLLKRGDMPTTTTALYLRYGASYAARVVLAPNKLIEYPARPGQAWRQLRRLNPTLPRRNGFFDRWKQAQSFRDFAQIIGADKQVAQGIRECAIYIPSPFLQSDIVLIDTPGVNSTEEEHKKTTIRVVRDEADLAIIAIPAQFQLQADIMEFIQTHLAPFIAHCLFVITRADAPDVQGNEMKLVHQRVLRQLASLGVEAPQVLVTAALPTLKVINRDKSITNEDRAWEQEFSKARAMIAALLQERAAVVIRTRIHSLFHRIIEQLTHDLQAQVHIFRTREAEIQRDTIANLETFKREESARFAEQLRAAAALESDAAKKIIEEARISLLSDLGTRIQKAQRVEDLNVIAQTTFVTVTQHTLTETIATLKRRETIQRAALQAEATFRQRFQEKYQILLKLAGQMPTAHMPTDTVQPELLTNHLNDASRRILDSFNAGKDHGLRAAARAVFRAQKQLGEYRQNLLAVCTQQTSPLFLVTAQQIDTAYRALADRWQVRMNDIIASQTARYAQVYEQVRTQQERDRTAIEARRVATEQAIAELRQRAMTLSHS